MPLYKVNLVRGEMVDERRLFHRYILGRRKRYVELVIFSGRPRELEIVKRLNAPMEINFEMPLYDWSADAAMMPYNTGGMK